MTIREMMYLEKVLILIRAASCAAREASIALNFVSQFFGMGKILVSSANAPDKGKVMTRMPIIHKNWRRLNGILNPINWEGLR